MPSQVEELVPLSLAPGSVLRTYIDHNKPEDSSEHIWTEVTYDGNSEVLIVINHWHRDHDEFMEVLEGRLNFYLNGKEFVASAGDPPILVPRGQIHGFSTNKGERTRFRELAKPAGDFKARFFQDLLQTGAIPGFLMMMRVAYDGDMYPSLGLKVLDYLLVSVVGLIAKPFVPAKPVELKRK